MIMSEKAKQHVDSCRFCWMCHHICPIGNATGQERCTARARALGISLVNRKAFDLSEIIDNIYECATCGGCVNVCTTGWDPVLYTKEVRLQAALDGKLPEYIKPLVENCLTKGNAYGKAAPDAALTKVFGAHAAKTDTLLLLGGDVRYGGMSALGVKAAAVLEKAGVDFTLLSDEPAIGTELDFLIGAAGETKAQMEKCAAVLNEYQTVIVYHPDDAKTVKQLYKSYGIDLDAKVVTFTAFVACLLKEGKLVGKNSGKTVVFQDPFALARDLEETDAAREIIKAFAKLDEMLLNRKETVWAGNLLMAQYMPEVIRDVARRRIGNAASIGASVMVTASAGEYAALKSVDQTEVEILSLEDLIIG